MAASDETAGRPRRRDARRNRAAIIRAAREEFATAGFDVAMDRIASRAGVGRGTLYRHFPDRDRLGAAIFEENVREIEAVADRHQGQAGAFDVLLRTVVDHQIASHALIVVLGRGAGAPDLDALGSRIVACFEEPIRRGQDDGSLRDDLRSGDVLHLLEMVAGVLEREPDPARRPAAADRALSLLTDGLRARRDA